MTLIDNRLDGLASSYYWLREEEAALPRNWRPRLLAAYANKREQFHLEREGYQRGWRKWRSRVQLSLSISLILFIIAVADVLFSVLLRPWLFPVWFIRFLNLGGFLFVVGLFALTGSSIVWFWWRMKQPQKPLHPAQVKLYYPLIPEWERAIKSSLPHNLPTAGAIGEFSWIRTLIDHLSSEFFVLYSLKQRHGEDIDVILIGPKGIWVFEVKFWNGYVEWQNNRWYREIHYFESGGVRQTKYPKVSQPPEHQWQRTAGDVSRTIQWKALHNIPTQSMNVAVRGGIVFTHAKATYNIAPGLPVAWGTNSFWLERIVKAPVIKGWQMETSLIIIDALLARHREIDPLPSVSVQERAQSILNLQEQQLAAWISN